MINYIYALLADLFFASSFAIQTKYQQKTDTSIRSGVFFNIISTVSVFPLLLALCGFTPRLTVYSFVSTFFSSAVLLAYTVISFYIIRAGSLSLYTLFLMTGGMIVPFIWGVCFLDESISLMQITGILLITGAIIFSSAEKKKNGTGIIILCILVFFLNGASSVISKLHQIETRYSTIGVYDYMFWGNVIRLITSFFLFPFAGKSEKIKIPFGAIAIAFFAAVLSCFASCFNLMGASNLPATVLYPLITGGTMVLSFVAEVVFLKQKITAKKFLPVLISFVGTLLFL